MESIHYLWRIGETGDIHCIYDYGFSSGWPTPWRCREHIYQETGWESLVAEPSNTGYIMMWTLLSTLHSLPSTSILMMIVSVKMLSNISLLVTDWAGGPTTSLQSLLPDSRSSLLTMYVAPAMFLYWVWKTGADSSLSSYWILPQDMGTTVLLAYHWYSYKRCECLPC